MSRLPSLVALAAGTALIATVGLAASTASASPDADSFSGATTYSDAAFTAQLDTTGATTEPGEPISVSNTATRQSTVWLRWTAPADTHATVTSSAAGKTGVAIFTGDSLTSADELILGMGAAEFDATAGHTYSLQISSIGAPNNVVTGPVSVSLATTPAPATKEDFAVDVPEVPNFTASPTNDKFAGAVSLASTGGTAVGSGTTVDATIESGEPRSIPGTSGLFFNTVWFKWKAPATGNISIAVDGASADTAIAVYTGAKVSKLSRIAVNDDFASNRDGQVVPVKVKKGSTYYIQVGLTGYSSPLSAPESFQLSLTGSYSSPSNDNLASAVTATKNVFAVSGTTIGATTERLFENTSNSEFPGSPVRGSVWWKWTAPAAGKLTATSVGSAGDTAVSISSVTPGHGYQRLAFSDDANGFAGSIVDHPITAGVTYFFAVSNVSSNEFPGGGAVKLNVTATLLGPVISTVSPSSGKLAGGTKITITGERLNNVGQVTIGGNPLTNVTVINSKKITGYTPASVSKGARIISTYNSGGYTTLFSPKTFTYK
jgi:hypothetical protein